jgi:hypothetical protein
MEAPTDALVAPAPRSSLGRRLAVGLVVLYGAALALRAAPAARTTATPAALAEEAATAAPLAGADTCLMSVAVGADYVTLAEFAGKTKAGYAARYNYRFLAYDFDDAASFMAWVRGTEFGAAVGADRLGDDAFTVTLLKFGPLAHALTEAGCANVFMTDADALMTDWSTPLTWAWGGADADSGTHLMWTLLPDDTWADGYCPTAPAAGGLQLAPGDCGDLGVFWNCLNTGTVLADASAYTLDFLKAAVELQLDGDQPRCSSAVFLPPAVGAAGHDQCPEEDDQCVVGCVAAEMAAAAGTPVAVPDEFACASAATEPLIQGGVMISAYIESVADCPNLADRLDADTFVVNCIGLDAYKATCLICAAAFFESTADVAASLSPADLGALLAVYPPANPNATAGAWDGLNARR